MRTDVSKPVKPGVMRNLSLVVPKVSYFFALGWQGIQTGSLSVRTSALRDGR